MRSFPDPSPKSPLFLLVVLVTASGAASLVYQVVWMRRLALVFGSTTLATSTVLAAFLGGLALGAWVWGLAADRRPHASLGTFGFIEAGIGLYALASPWAFGTMERIYVAAYAPLADRHALFIGLQFVLSALVIVPPAMLMGGSVPLVARRLVARPGEATAGVGLLYGWNTLGAAAGAGLGAYGFLPALGLSGAVRLAAAANLLIAAIALLVDARDRARGAVTAPVPEVGAATPGSPAADPAAATAPAGTTDAAAARGPRLPAPAGEPGLDPVAVFVVLQAFGLSGFAVITYEVAWSRLLALTMGSSVYAFGTLVVIILAGLGIGSAAYARARLSAQAHLAAFALLQCLIGLAAVASLLIAPRLPWLFMRFYPVFRDAFGWQVAAYVVLTALLAFPPALLSGATFPAVIGSLGGALARLGRTFGTAYGANTVGTVLGAFLAGFVFIPALGLRAAIVIGVVANLIAGVSVLLRTMLPWRRRLPALLAAASALAIVVTLPPWPREVFAAGVGFFASRFGSTEAIETAIRDLRLLYYKDGINTTISVDQVGDHLVYRSNGKTDASTYPTDMSTQQLLGHLPMLRHAAPRDVFVLGLGTGVTAAAVARYPVRRIDIVELEPAGIEASRFFDRQNRSILNDPRVRLVLADGRNRLRASADRYDIIISDPSDLWVAGTGALFTLEFYAAARARLRPGGIMVQWIHTHALSPDDLALLVATFRAVFPQTEIWTPAFGDLILLGLVERSPWDYRRVSERLAGIAGVADDLQSIGIWHPAAVFAGYVLGPDGLPALIGGVRRPHTDDRPVLEFRTPRSLYVATMPLIAELLDRLRGQPFPPVAGFDPARDLDADATYLLGFAYASLGQSRRGIPYMERSTRMAPDRPLFYVGLANQYREVGRTRDAEDAYRRALALDPRNVEALTALGEVLLDAGQAGRAAALAERALRLAPEDIRARALLDRARNPKP